jgi:hypothetical protein
MVDGTEIKRRRSDFELLKILTALNAACDVACPSCGSHDRGRSVGRSGQHNRFGIFIGDTLVLRGKTSTKDGCRTRTSCVPAAAGTTTSRRSRK